jgi:hypothetical protein
MRRALVAAIAAMTVVPQAATAVWSPAVSASRASDWLAARAGADGSFGGVPADIALEAAVAMSQGGDHPVTPSVTYAREEGRSALADAGNAGRMILALRALGQNVRSFGGVDYVHEIESRYDAVTGSYDERNGYANALAVLGLVVERRPVPERAFDRIAVARCTGGGYSSTVPCVNRPDVDTTALVIHVLTRAGRTVDAETIAWLRAMQNADGGFGRYDGDRATNANSTGLASSAIVALQHDPESWARGGNDPIDALRALQRTDGSFRYRLDADGDALGATVQAIPGVLARAYPLTVSPTRRGPQAQSTTQLRTTPPTSPAAIPSGRCVGSGPNEASITVMHQDQPMKRCVAFSEPSISGLQLIERSGFRVLYQDFGAGNIFVCAIDGRGRDHPRESCIPPCPSQQACTFWGYYEFVNGDWSFAQVGAGARNVRDGDHFGWRWGIHSTTGGCPPDPAIKCSAAAPQIASSSAGDSNDWTSRSVALGGALLMMSLLATIGLRSIKRKGGTQ